MIYDWGLWGDITDRFPAHPQSIDCMLTLNDSVICTGCMDGNVRSVSLNNDHTFTVSHTHTHTHTHTHRSVQILPNQILSVCGQHTEGLPVDNMCLTRGQQYLVTSSQDSCRFWCMEDIPKLPQTTDRGKTRGRKRKRKQRADNEDPSTGDFFAELCS